MTFQCFSARSSRALGLGAVLWLSSSTLLATSRGADAECASVCDDNPHHTSIALDIDGNGKVERISGEFAFDFHADGEKTTVTQWFGVAEGILVDTRFHGAISGKYVFGDFESAFRDGFEKLATWDLNQDGWIQGGELMHLGLWVDANSNARLDYGELRSMVERDVIRLAVKQESYFAQALLENGQTVLMENVSLPRLMRENHTAEQDNFSEQPLSVLAFFSALGLFFSGVYLWRYRENSIT